MESVVGIIPARLASVRFPQKVLADRTGKPLIQHVFEAAALSRVLGRVVIAADDERIAAAVRGFGGEVVMTSADHANGTSRLNEAALRLGLSEDQIVVNLQGDEPELESATVASAVEALVGGERGESQGRVSVGTVAAPLLECEAADPNIVKVVRTLDGRALYFSRAKIPHVRDAGEGAQEGGGAGLLRHVGVYVYRVGFLRRYAALPPTPLEQAERLEQLRVLEHGYSIGVGLTERAHSGIDTPEQYEAFVERWRGSNEQSSAPKRPITHG